MNEISLRNILRLYSGPILSTAIFLLLAITGVALLFQSWWIGGATGLAAIAFSIYFYRDLLYWVKTGRAFDAAKRGSYVETEALLREAYLCTKSFADDDWRRVIVLSSLIHTTRMQGNYDDAEAFGIEGLSTAEKVCGNAHVLTMDMALLLAGIYLDLAQYAKADALLQKCAPVLEAAPPDTRGWFAECLRLQGRLWSEQGRDAQAEPFLRRAYEAVPPDKADAEILRCNCALDLASTCAKRRNLEEADELTQQALEGLKRTGESESPVAARALEVHAMVRFLQRRFPEAEEIQRRSLALTEKLSGPNMPASSSGLNQLGEILKAQGKLTEAESSLRTALRLRQEYMAPDHPLLAEVLENLADLLFKVGRGEEAELHAERAGNIRALYSPFRIV